MNAQRCKLLVLVIALVAFGALLLTPDTSANSNRKNAGGHKKEDGEQRKGDGGHDRALDARLSAILKQQGFTGRVGSGFERRLGRRIDNQLADLGRDAFHDNLLGLANDNSCAGCHAAPAGFGDTQSIAIGIGNNNIVGPDRAGPRNQRRSPMLLNTAFFPALMWNSRFASLTGDPFDNSGGFQFPLPEGLSLSELPHLLTAQAFIPVTEKPEMAGFHASLPGTNNDIREEVVARLNATPEYRKLFGKSFREVKDGAPITYEMLARAIAEFEFTLNFADAPLDMFARGQQNALTDDQKRGAVLFFDEANCASCHAVSGQSNEMFSDFRTHVAGIPQLNPTIKNVMFDGPGENEDFGLEQVTGNPNDRYAFRTSPLRNLALQTAFFHNGAFTVLEDAVRYHLDAVGGAAGYSAARAGVDPDLRGAPGPIAPVLARLDPLLATPRHLSPTEFRQLIDFLRVGLQDPRATPQRLRKLLPQRLPSGRPLAQFQ